MANYAIKNARGDAVVREDEIYDWFVDKDNASLCDYANKPFEFVRKVIRNVEHYLAFGSGLAGCAWVYRPRDRDEGRSHMVETIRYVRRTG